MNTFAFVVTIVAIACATSVINQYLRTKRKTAEKGADVDDTLTQLEALEERIRVLERIVTESKFDLKREIDKL